MPQLDDISKYAEALKPAYVHYEQTLCVTARNRHSKCRRCIEVCPIKAITFMGKSLLISKNDCVNCGACCTVCPSQALAPLAPTDEELARAAAQATVAADGIACFTCARAASKRVAQADKIIEVACLSRVDESLVAGLAAHGVSRILFVDGNCSTCKYGSCGALAAETAAQINELFEAFETPARVECTSTFPDELLSEFDGNALGNERRSLFSQSKNAATNVATNVALDTIQKQTGINLKGKVGLRQAVRHPAVTRHDDLLNAFDGLGEPQMEASFRTRRFGTVDIDESTCSGCLKCALACPAKALVQSPIPRPEGETGRYLEFTASKCIDCGICQDVCSDGCLKLWDEVGLADLFDFEPRLIPIAPSPYQSNIRPSLFGGPSNAE